MEHAFAFLDRLFEYIWAFVPKPYQVKFTERGVRYRRGNPPVLVKPGFHWYWPLTTQVKVINVMDRAEEFVPTELVTKDSKSVCIGYSMVYRVEDPVVAHSSVDDFEQTMAELAETVLTPFVLSHTYAEVLMALEDMHSRHSLNKLITRGVRRLLRPYGLKVTWARVRTAAPTRVFKIYTDER